MSILRVKAKFILVIVLFFSVSIQNSVFGSQCYCIRENQLYCHDRDIAKNFIGCKCEGLNLVCP